MQTTPSSSNLCEPFLPRQNCPISLSSFNKRCPLGKDINTDLKANTLYQFIMGQDKSPVALDADWVSKNLKDSFPKLLDKTFPLNLIDLINQARKIFSNTLSEEAEKKQVAAGKQPFLQVYRIAEGGMIKTAKTIDRTFRLTIALFALGNSSPDIFVSTGSQIDSNDQFLQVMSWDPSIKQFNFYARNLGTWMWAGRSQHALEEKTRGQSPFCGHANGAPLMKELKIPWMNWRSSASSFDESILPKDSPLISKYPFLSDRSEELLADNLELIVRGGISNWNNSRINDSVKTDLKTNKLINISYFIRQILSTTIVNLTSSLKTNQSQDDIVLPLTFFINVDAFSALQFKGPFSPITITHAQYVDCLTKYNSNMNDESSYKEPGDTFFSFFVPEPAAEDINLMKILINKQILSQRLAACFLMIDFYNPIYSSRRETLLKYIPDQLTANLDVKSFTIDLENQTVDAISKSDEAKNSNSPEFEFLKYWQIAQKDGWQDEFNNQLLDYLKKVKELALDVNGFDGYFKLAEFRRWSFKNTPLFEFPLTFANTNIPESVFPLEMTIDGKVKIVS